MTEREVWTYSHQPMEAITLRRIGLACERLIYLHGPGASTTDLGLALLMQLEEMGYGVFDLPEDAGPSRE